MVKLSDERALHLTLNPNLIESCMSGLLLGEGFLVEDLHGVKVISDSALHLVYVRASALAERLPSDNFIVTQS